MTYRFPPGYGDYGLDETPRDRSFTPALEAQEARERAAEHRAAGRVDEWDFRQDEGRARNASTDPRWDGKAGGLPEPPMRLTTVDPWGPIGGTTIDPPPTAETLSPAQRAKLERILLDLKCAHDEVAKFLERA